MAKAKGKKTLSRIKYDQNHPTVSARLPKEKRDKLLAVLRSLGLTLAHLLINFADEYEVKVKPLDEARREGYEEAKNRFIVAYLCRKCGKPIPITSPKAKAAAASYMVEHGWGHTECPK